MAKSITLTEHNCKISNQNVIFFFQTPTLTASNFAVLWPTDPKFSAFKDLNLLKKHTKNQEASSILRVVFALSKSPHLHRELSNRPGMSVSHCISAIVDLTITNHTFNFYSNTLLAHPRYANKHTATFIWNRCLLNSLCKWGHFERAKTTLKMLLAS